MEALVEVIVINVRKLLVLAVVIIVLLIVGGAASRAVRQQANANADAPIFTSAYILGGTKTNDLFVIADTAHLLTGSRVQADASLIGRSSVTLEGHVDGDLTVMGGDIRVGKEAQITGDAVFIGNTITLAGHIDGNLNIVADTLTINPGSQFKGTLDICAAHVTNEYTGDGSVKQCGADELAGWQSLRDGSFAAKAISGSGFSVASFVFSGMLALALAALSGIVATIFPRRFGQMTQVIRTLPARVSRIGCLTQVLTVILVALLGLIIAVLPPFGLVLLPILALLMLLLGVLFAIGGMTIALLTGDWFVRRFALRSSPPMLTMIAGSLGLFLLWTLLGILPFGPILRLLMVILMGAVGLGAVMMTRVGARSAGRSYFVQG